MDFSDDRTASEANTLDNIDPSTDGICLTKIPKVYHREDVTKQRQTVAVTDDVTEALTNHNAAGDDRVNVQRELLTNVAPSGGQQAEAESELAQAFSKLRGRTSQIAQTSVGIEQNEETEYEESVKKSSQYVHSNPVTSLKLTTNQVESGFSQKNQVGSGLSSIGPDGKCATSLATDENDVQITSSMKNMQTFHPGDPSDTKRRSVAPDASSSGSHSTNTLVSHAETETSHSVEMEKCCINSSVIQSGDKEVTKSAQSTAGVLIASVSQPTRRSSSGQDIQSVGQPGDQNESSSFSVDSKRTTADVEHRDNSNSKKQTSMLKAAESVASDTICMVEKSISDDSHSSDVGPQQPCGSLPFLRQTSYPGKTEHHVIDAEAQMLNRSLNASSDNSANLPHAVQGLRSCAEWKTDDSGNKLEIKLKKSHSIALKPRKESTSTDAGPGNRPTVKRTASTTDSPAYCPNTQRYVTSSARPEAEVLAESSDKSTGGNSIFRSTDAEVINKIRHSQSLKADKFTVGKKLPSMAITGSCYEAVPGEPIWIALARQKTQRWTEGKV